MKFSTTALVAGFISLAIKMLGLYALIYFGFPDQKIFFYTVLITLSEIYEFCAIIIVSQKYKLKEVIYSIVGIVNLLILFTLLISVDYLASDLYLLGFLIILIYSLLGGLWTGAINGTFGMISYGVYLSYQELLQPFAFRIPFLLFIGIIGGIIGNIIAKKTLQLDTSIEKNTYQKAVNEFKTDFTLFFSRNLQVPLYSVKDYLRILLSDQENKLTKEEKIAIYEHILGSTKTIERIVDNLISLSALENGNYKIKPYFSNLDTIVLNVINEKRNTAKSKQVEIEYIQPKVNLPQILFDSQALFEIIKNIITLTINFAKKKSVINVKTEKKETNVIFTIYGNGVEKLINKYSDILKNLEENNNYYTNKAYDTVLGLYIAKLMVEAYNGKIFKEDDNKRGAYFGFSFPEANSNRYNLIFKK